MVKTAYSRRAMLALVGLGGFGTVWLMSTREGGRNPLLRADSNTPTTDSSTCFARYQAADEPNGDLARVTWPPFILRAGPEVKQLYEFQVTNGDLMKYMPCFCGCQYEDDHRSNRDCYVDQVNPDGSVVFDAMAPT